MPNANRDICYRDVLLRGVALALLVSAALVAPASAVAGQATASPDTAELSRTADEFQRTGRWREAAAVLERLTQLRPDDATGWTRLGLAWSRGGDHARAADALRRAFALRPQPGIAYRIAVSYAHQNLENESAAYLDSAMALGFGNADVYASEAAFHRWRDDPKFRDMPARLRAVSRPCEQRRESRQLDYWVGTWEQRNLNGLVVGETDYHAALSGCALVEQTSNPPLYTATAFHYFSPERATWVQHYLDSAGKDLWYSGHVRGDTLVYQLASPPIGGRTVYRNTTVRETNDRIRWRFEQSDDGGRTWRVSFDGFYVRKKG